jgi:hypothetical protein
MPAGYAATTGVESTYGDAFTYEISDLRVAERLPWVTGPGGVIVGPITPATPGRFHLEPAGAIVAPLAPSTRRPSNIVPIKTTANTGGSDPGNDVFYLGLDVEFVGTHLGLPGYPNTVDVEVRFFLEAYGVEGGLGPRHEINIAPQIFAGLNANPNVVAGFPDTELRHQLWVQVAESGLSDNPPIIQAPVGPLWDDLFNPDTIYRVAASVKIVAADLVPLDRPAATGFIEGAVFQTEEWSPHTV